MSSASFGRIVVFAVAVIAVARVARAEDRCPLGSIEKTESGFAWCEPSICATDSMCPTGSICRPVSLCVEVGALDAGKDDAGGARLLARQRCGADKSCPQNTACSEKGRCITKAEADRAGLTVAATSTTAPPSAPADPPKKACGCDVPGRDRGAMQGGALAMLGLVVVAARRRAARRRSV